ncbi:MAG: hypothetical protein R8F63_13565 [Acidimicrobiales bacterium]|nr:hypothetical protein [Acidimicrobiales bacterium]
MSTDGAARLGLHALRLHDERMRRYAHRMVGSPSDMDAVLTVAYAAAHREQVDRATAPSPLIRLYRAVHRSCRAHLSKPIEGDGAPAPEANAGVLGALALVPIDDRGLVLLVDGEELAVPDAAQAVEIDETGAPARLAHARAVITETLEHDRGQA